ncbi:MAG: type II toxin-antitoxin system VapC family toxin [Acidimicrobiia bacterium]|nr:type II toxin-antitoxin system VapC family toxin [Acidimicrobiia bacterium]MYB78707.1 type II toxin-antitoxin system VapC family toxin [Acidimicrobiia bacterium]
MGGRRDSHAAGRHRTDFTRPTDHTQGPRVPLGHRRPPVICYFDTSAIIPLLVEEPLSRVSHRLWHQASWVATARISYVEARAGLGRASRMGRISSDESRQAAERLNSLYRQFYQVEITPGLVTIAGDIAADLGLRAYDAIQLAAAVSLQVDDLILITGDRELARTAGNLGLRTISDPGRAGTK